MLTISDRHRLHRRVRFTVLPGCLLGLSPNQDGGAGRRQDSFLDPVLGVLLHMHAIRAAQCRRNLPVADAHRPVAAAREECRGLRR